MSALVQHLSSLDAFISEIKAQAAMWNYHISTIIAYNLKKKAWEKGEKFLRRIERQRGQ